MTVATPKTAPSMPWYLPRSRNGMMSAISAMAVTISPPAPMPCTARQPTSQLIELARPHSAEAMTNRAVLIWKTRLRPKRSPNFPARTVAMVLVIR
jgi:hypothetical protein